MVTYHIPPDHIFQGTDKCNWELYLGEQSLFVLEFDGYSTRFHERHPALSGLEAPYNMQVTF